MKSIINEALIYYHRWQMQRTKCKACMVVHMTKMYRCIYQRNKARIERMERDRGIN